MMRCLAIMLLALAAGHGTAHGEAGVYAKKELRVRITRQARPPVVIEESLTRMQIWHAPPLERNEHEGTGFAAQLGTTLHDERDGSTWMLDDARKLAARLSGPMLDEQAAAWLRADYDVALAGPDAKPYSFVALGDSTEFLGVRAQHYLLETGSKKIRVELWIAAGLPLSSRDFGSALRRRVGKQPPSAVERFIAAWERLPGYPVKILTVARSDTATITTENLLVEVRRMDIPADRLTVPAGYRTHASPGDLITARIEAQQMAKDQAFLRERGLDRPFVPTQAQPLPKPLEGGSCRQRYPQTESCLEWASSGSTIKESCLGDGVYSTASCDRSAILGMCVTVERGHVFYRYLPLEERRWKHPQRQIKEACSSGSFHEKPGALAAAEARALAFVAYGGAWHCEMPAGVCFDLYARSAVEAKTACIGEKVKAGPCPDRTWDGACWEEGRLTRYHVGSSGRHWCTPELRATPAGPAPRPAADSGSLLPDQR